MVGFRLQETSVYHCAYQMQENNEFLFSKPQIREANEALMSYSKSKLSLSCGKDLMAILYDIVVVRRKFAENLKHNDKHF